MKTISSLMAVLMAMFLVLTICEATEVSDSGSIVVNIINEKSSDGNFIQLANYSIAKIDAVYLDNGTGVPKKADVADLYSGALVEAILAERSEDGTWRASQVIIKDAKALDDAIAALPDAEKSALMEAQERLDTASNAESAGKIQEQPQDSETPKREDDVQLKGGVWSN